jgi:DNA-binding transcriptional regulator YdaS (Cro superfamily)
MTPQQAFKKAIKLLQGQNKASKLMGFSQPAISRQISSGRKPKPEHCLLLELLTKGEVTRYQLRPDIYGKSSGKD